MPLQFSSITSKTKKILKEYVTWGKKKRANSTQKEFFKLQGEEASPAKTFGGFDFRRDIFGDDLLTPHEEMRRSLDYYDSRPLIASGIRQLTRFIIGNKVTAISSDKPSQDFVQTWINRRNPELVIEMENAIIQSLVTGQSYVEPIWGHTTSGQKKFDNIATFPDASKVYLNLYGQSKELIDEKDDTGKFTKNWYIIKVPLAVKEFAGQKSTYYKIAYFVDDNVLFEMTWAVAFPKTKFHHLKLGYSRNGFYGRSYISSVLDDAAAVEEIIKNIAVISRYRALNMKIIMPADQQQEILEDDIAYMKNEMFNMEPGSHIFLQKKLTVEDFSNSGQYDTLMPEIEFLRKEISSGLVPNFITSFNSDVNRATAEEAKIPFVLELEYLKNIFESFFTRLIVDNLKKTKPSLKDVRIRFGVVDMESRTDKVNYFRDLYSAGVVTFNEYRKAAGLEPVEGGNKFSFQIQTPQDSSLALLNAVKGVVKNEITEKERDDKRKNDDGDQPSI